MTPNPGPANTVMLIEDNPDHALLIQTALEDSPHVQGVRVIGDGEQALNYIQVETAAPSATSLPGLVVLDLKLPKVDGLDILRAIRASPVWQKIPVVVL
ncbi:MAG: response regulator, partial [Anaerolineales bacterium]